MRSTHGGFSWIRNKSKVSVSNWHLWLHHGQVLDLYLQCSLHDSGLSSCLAWSCWGEQEHGQSPAGHPQESMGSEKALSLDPKLRTWSKSWDNKSLLSMSCNIQKVLRARLKRQPRGDAPSLGSPLLWDRPDCSRRQDQAFGETAEP